MIVLASNSPRRKELLGIIDSNFRVCPADIDEESPDILNIEEVPEYLAVQKALAVAQIYPNDTIIGADTVVIIENQILGKPRNDAEAFKMLKMLSGKTHTVITGVAVCDSGRTKSFSEKSHCTFYELTEAEINNYIATGEPRDKAGAYGIQGKGALLIKEIIGDYYNIMGLPIARLSRHLTDFMQN